MTIFYWQYLLNKNPVQKEVRGLTVRDGERKQALKVKLYFHAGIHKIEHLAVESDFIAVHSPFKSN